MDDGKPRIGVSANLRHRDPKRSLYDGRPLLYLEESMGTWLMRGGARPYLIPFAVEGNPGETTLEEMLRGMEGLVLHGGADVAPESYGGEPLREEWSGDRVRDLYEIALVEAALEQDIPVLAICRGLQLANVALGGTLYQDVATQVDEALTHRDPEAYDGNRHRVVFEADGRLAEMYDGMSGGEVVSVHHQAVEEVADALVVEARSAGDGIVEALRIERRDRYLLGLQWHPEFQDPEDESLLDPMVPLRDFLRAVEARRGASGVARG